jgi:hypothetical protein
MNTATLVPSTQTAPATSVVTRTAPIHKGEPTIRSVHRASTTTGAVLLLMSALSAIGYLVAVKELVTQRDAGFVLFGFHLLLIAYLRLSDRQLRKIVCPRLLARRRVARHRDASAITGLGEFVFALRLLLGRRRIELRTYSS